MKHFSFSIPQNVYYGWGSLNDLTEIAAKTEASKAFIVSGPHLKKSGYVDRCAEMLTKAGIRSEAFTETEGNPSTDTVEKAAALFKESGAQMIVAFGGGSPLDVAKASRIGKLRWKDYRLRRCRQGYWSGNPHDSYSNNCWNWFGSDVFLGNN